MTVSQSTHRRFGATGLQIPRVVFGTGSLGNLFLAIGDDAKRELVREWFAQMPKPVAIDNAGKYGAGLSLEVLGRELAALGIDRSDVIISNKLAWRRVPLTTPEPTFEPGVWIDIEHDAVQDISYNGILRCYEDGCRMLGEYQPQLISVHDPDEYLDSAADADDRNKRLDDIRGAYRALAELRDAGKAAGVGVGSKDWRVIRELDQHCELDWVMIANSFTIMDHPPELVEFIDALTNRDIAVINSAVFHGGFLVGGNSFDYRPIDPTDPEDADRLKWRERFQAVCERHGQQPFDAAVAFAISHPGIASVAMSTSRPDRIAEMVHAATTPLAPEFWQSMRGEGLIDQDYAHLL